MHAMALCADHILLLSTGNTTSSISRAQSAPPFLVRKIVIMNMTGMFTVITITQPNLHSVVTDAKRQY